MNNASLSLQDMISLYQQGQSDKALSVCLKFLKTDKKNINLLNFAGIVYDSIQQKAKAARYFRQALNIQPTNIQLMNNLTGTLIELKQSNEAEKLLVNAIKKSDANAETYYTLGNVYKIQENDDEAQKYYQLAIALDANHFRALNNLSTILHKQGDLDGAIDALERALKINTERPLAYEALGAIYYEKFRSTEDYNFLSRVKQLLLQALEYNQELPNANFLLGKIFLDHEKNPQAAAPYILQANTLEPDNEEYRIQLGTLYYAQGELEQAESIFNDLYSRNGQKVIVLEYLGKFQHEHRNYEKAKFYYEKALKIEPDNTSLLNNLGYLFKESNKVIQSRDLFLRAIAIEKVKNPEKNPPAFKNGWDNHRFRSYISGNALKPCPDRETIDLNNKSILWLTEQGIGDELFFLRFIPTLEKYHCQNTYYCSNKILPLLKPLDILHSVSNQTYPVENFDHVFSIGDLPYIVGHDFDQATPPPLKLVADENILDSIQTVLSQFGPPPYIGLSWSAGHLVQHRRIGSYVKNIDLEVLCKEIKDLPGSFISLQNNPPANELEFISRQLKRPLLDASHFHDDLPRMLALLDLIDNYFTVSNTYVHMREGLSKTTNVFVVTPPEWRWLTRGDRSIWMPHSNIYRQSDDFSWTKAMDKFRTNLASIHS